jgi:hypothetical protein
MNRRFRIPTLLALLISAALASAYVIVAKNGPSGPTGQVPAGVLH